MRIWLLVGLLCVAWSVSVESEARCAHSQSGSCRMMKQGKPRSLPMALSSKQMEMQSAHEACMAHAEKGREAVLDHVFGAFTFEIAEATSMADSIWRGSPEHHGNEVCLARMIGLSQYASPDAVSQDAGIELVPMTSSQLYLPPNMFREEERFARPWVHTYLELLASRLANRLGVDERIFGARLRVTSLLRTVPVQQHLVRRGMSPADCRHVFLCSTHTTGAAVDLGFRGVEWKERQALFELLVEDQVHRKVYFIIEGSHFHLFVLPPL